MLLSFFDQDKKGVFKYKNTVLSSFSVFLRVGGQCPNLFVKIQMKHPDVLLNPENMKGEVISDHLLML